MKKIFLKKPAVLTSYVLRTGADRPIIHRAWNDPMTGCSASTPVNLAPVLCLRHLLTMPTHFHRRWHPHRAGARLPVPPDSVLGRSYGLLIIVWRAETLEDVPLLSSAPSSRRIAVVSHHVLCSPSSTGYCNVMLIYSWNGHCWHGTSRLILSWFSCPNDTLFFIWDMLFGCPFYSSLIYILLPRTDVIMYGFGLHCQD